MQVSDPSSCAVSRSRTDAHAWGFSHTRKSAGCLEVGCLARRPVEGIKKANSSSPLAKHLSAVDCFFAEAADAPASLNCKGALILQGEVTGTPPLEFQKAGLRYKRTCIGRAPFLVTVCRFPLQFRTGSAAELKLPAEQSRRMWCYTRHPAAVPGYLGDDISRYYDVAVSLIPQAPRASRPRAPTKAPCALLSTTFLQAWKLTADSARRVGALHGLSDQLRGPYKTATFV